MAVSEDQVIEYLEGLNVVELNDLVKKLEEKWDVKAAAGGAVMMAGPAGGDAGGAEEPTEFDVILTGPGPKKIQVIKEVRAITGLGLKDAKALVDGAPNPVKQGISKDEAEELQGKLEEAGGEVEVKPS